MAGLPAISLLRNIRSMKTLILYHSKDLDGVLSGVIANYYITSLASPNDIIVHCGADYGDMLDIEYNGYRLSDFDKIYVIDFSDDWLFRSEHNRKIIWIDHHISAFNKGYPVAQYFRNGVAACRLTQQFFNNLNHDFLDVYDYVNRTDKVVEPLFVALAGEYDIWDESSVYARPLNFGIRNISFKSIDFLYREMKSVVAGVKNNPEDLEKHPYFNNFITIGNGVVDYIQGTSERLSGGVPFQLMGHSGVWFNTHIKSSLIHRLNNNEDFIMVWNDTGKPKLNVSFYSDKIDISKFAIHFGGGGHKGAAGCQMERHILSAVVSNQYKYE